ncbi:hypothetical protein TSUD_84290 [Trifolium subterraneum]|uniref:Uncharacterized protein n=1 Tax=Trifolium subterraneum TaxID=3900 RepID=A0A2Z6PIA7_TRISU|nr:hypothetical protein TSUD_84290 [Trifolium subterraneum]
MDISQRQQNTTKGKLPHEKDPEPFKDEVDETLNRKFRNILLCWKGDTNIHEDEVDKMLKVNRKTLKVNRKTLKVNRKTRKIPVSKDRPNIYKDKVDKTQKVDSTKGKLPLCMDHPNIYEDEADKTQKVNRNTRKIPALKDHPNIYEDEVDKTEKSTVLDTGTVLARMYARIEREKELELSKEVDKMQKVDSTREKIPRGMEPEPFTREDLNQKMKMKNQQLPWLKGPKTVIEVTYSFEEENIADTDAIMAEVMARYGCEE